MLQLGVKALKALTRFISELRRQRNNQRNGKRTHRQIDRPQLDTFFAGCNKLIALVLQQRSESIKGIGLSLIHI